MHSAQPARRNQGAIRTAKNLHFHCQQACARSVQVLRRQSARRVLTAMVQGASYNWQATCIGDMGGSAQVAPSAVSAHRVVAPAHWHISGPGVAITTCTLQHPMQENNKAPILVVLRRYLPSEVQGTVLEVASGTGQHISHFARALPAVEWQPSDLTAELFPSIAAHSSGLSNVRAPLVLDASWTPDKWCATLAGRGQQQYDGVIVANMTHISPWAATQVRRTF